MIHKECAIPAHLHRTVEKQDKVPVVLMPYALIDPAAWIPMVVEKNKRMLAGRPRTFPRTSASCAQSMSLKAYSGDRILGHKLCKESNVWSEPAWSVITFVKKHWYLLLSPPLSPHRCVRTFEACMSRRPWGRTGGSRTGTHPALASHSQS